MRALCGTVGKHAVSCGTARLHRQRAAVPQPNDAVRMLEAHYATADEIDTAMKLGCALPMGPFELLDVVGNDVSLAIQRELYLEFRELLASRWRRWASTRWRCSGPQDPARVPRLQLALRASRRLGPQPTRGRSQSSRVPALASGSPA
ncbi:MAG: 3-hydroxyacyl-CoA dehydrogenase family protein [Nocardioides sp.]